MLQIFFLHIYIYSKFVQQCSEEEMGEIGAWGKSRTLYLPRPMTRTDFQPEWLVADWKLMVPDRLLLYCTYCVARSCLYSCTGPASCQTELQ
jgi:hypothetical protein